jgi:hypothetical protein
MKTTFVVIGVIAFLAACGGSDGGGTSTPACTNITGTWHFTDTLTGTSTSFCAAALSSDTSTVSLASTGANTFTWTETSSQGRSFVANGNGSIATCSGNITLSLAGTSQQPNYTINIAANRNVNFVNNGGNGVSQVTLTTSPQQAGTPCTGNFNTTATR